MSEASRIADVLGGRKVLGVEVKKVDDLLKLTRRGLPVQVVQVLEVRSGLGREAFGKWVTLSERTLSRRLTERYLKPDESDRAVRIARVVARAEEALGSADKARAWLRRPNRALGMAEPVSLLDTDLGAQQVTDVLGRIEQGTFS